MLEIVDRNIKLMTNGLKTASIFPTHANETIFVVFWKLFDDFP